MHDNSGATNVNWLVDLR